VCGECDREDRMLLCDGCDLGYHLECLDPPMNTVPLEEWFCPECTLSNSGHLAEEVTHLSDDIYTSDGWQNHTSQRRKKVWLKDKNLILDVFLEDK